MSKIKNKILLIVVALLDLFSLVESVLLPNVKKLELIRENKRLQKALNIKEVLYIIYNIKKPEYNNSEFDLTVYDLCSKGKFHS